MNEQQRQALIAFGTALAGVGVSRWIGRDSRAAPLIALAGAALVFYLTRGPRMVDDAGRAQLVREALRARAERAEVFVPATARDPVTIEQGRQ